MTKNLQAVLDLLALAHSIKPMEWRYSPYNQQYEWLPVGEPEGCYCPLTHAAEALTGLQFSWDDPESAAAALGIPATEAGQIILAADVSTRTLRKQKFVQSLRKQLLAVYDLDAEVEEEGIPWILN